MFCNSVCLHVCPRLVTIKSDVSDWPFGRASASVYSDLTLGIVTRRPTLHLNASMCPMGNITEAYLPINDSSPQPTDVDSILQQLSVRQTFQPSTCA